VDGTAPAQLTNDPGEDGRQLDEPDGLIARLRGVIADLAFDLEASDLLSDGADPHRPAGVRPTQQVLDLGECLRQLDEEHHQARERLFDQLPRRGGCCGTHHLRELRETAGGDERGMARQERWRQGKQEAARAGHGR
jgi:hypothetical protein